MLMFSYTKKDIIHISNEHNFIKDTVEKVLRLIDILKFINSSKFCNELALKGGTAINLCIFDLPRLSVDIDFDYAVNISKEDLIGRRNEIKTTLSHHMEEQGYTLTTQSKFVHTLDSFVFRYTTLSGAIDTLKIEINYSDRCHILPLVKSNTTDILCMPIQILRLSNEELIGSKINALIARTTPRDVYDVYNIITHDKITNKELIKKITLFYLILGTDNSLNTIEEMLNIAFDKMNSFNFNKIRQTILPVVHKGEKIDIDLMVQTVKDYLIELMKLNQDEQEYIIQFRNHIYKPELLFGDNNHHIINHPMAVWKTKKHI